MRGHIPDVEPQGTGLLWGPCPWEGLAVEGEVPGPPPPPQAPVPSRPASQAEPPRAGPLGLPYAMAGLDHGLGRYKIQTLGLLTSQKEEGCKEYPI